MAKVEMWRCDECGDLSDHALTTFALGGDTFEVCSRGCALKRLGRIIDEAFNQGDKNGEARHIANRTPRIW